MKIREPIAVYDKTHVTEGEYLHFERTSLEKHEFFRGEVFAMAGASPRHNKIFSNLFIALESGLRANHASRTEVTCESISRKIPLHLSRYFRVLRGIRDF